MGEITRRSFIKGAALATGSAITGIAATAGAASAEEASSDIQFEAEADYVIVGTGAAGLAAAVTCGLEGLGEAIILEAAPEELSGGNSSVCGQACFCPKTVEAAIEYQTALNLPYEVEPELMESWAKNICENGDWLINNCNAKMVYRDTAEFPEAEGSDGVGYWANETMDHDETGRGWTWIAMKDTLSSIGTPIYYDTRAVDLIEDPASDEICGVSSEDGRNFKARRGVILACGGFEWNREMMDMYMTCGFVGAVGKGTFFARGDGIKMAQRVGAQLWHMNNFSGMNFGIRIGDDETSVSVASFDAANHDYIFLDPEGKRFMYEESRGLARHGKIYAGGTWADMRIPGGSHAVFGQASFDTANVFTNISFSGFLTAIPTCASNQELLDAGLLVKSDTVSELASALGCDEATLQETLDKYNGFAANNLDEDYKRGQVLSAEGSTTFTSNGAVATALDGFDLVAIEPPYYSYQIVPIVINSQGGPKRDATGNIVDVDGNPIPRLYGAGEMGCIYPYKYNVGGNFSEAISSGRLAMRSAGTLEPRN